MTAIDVIHQHRSIREYETDPVPDDLLTEILEAGIRASSSGNMQTYSIVVTRDRGLREQLYEPHLEQSMVLDAPVLLTFCADFRRMRRWLRLSDAPDNFDNFMSFMIAAIDAILVSQNVALAAESKGLGICYMGTTLANCQQVGRILQLPHNVVPVVGFSLGYPPKTRTRATVCRWMVWFTTKLTRITRTNRFWKSTANGKSKAGSDIWASPICAGWWKSPA
jgi:nitroreductase